MKAQSPIKEGLETSTYIEENIDGSKSNVLERLSMGSRKNRSGEERRVKSSQKEPDMEAQAATKIQAGFRGYQVRKQMKIKVSNCFCVDVGVSLNWLFSFNFQKQ